MSPPTTRPPALKKHQACKTCKGRRIRCDAVRPACGPCQSRSLPCNFPGPQEIEAAFAGRKGRQLRVRTKEKIKTDEVVVDQLVADNEANDKGSRDDDTDGIQEASNPSPVPESPKGPILKLEQKQCLATNTDFSSDAVIDKISRGAVPPRKSKERLAYLETRVDALERLAYLMSSLIQTEYSARTRSRVTSIRFQSCPPPSGSLSSEAEVDFAAVSGFSPVTGSSSTSVSGRSSPSLWNQDKIQSEDQSRRSSDLSEFSFSNSMASTPFPIPKSLSTAFGMEESNYGSWWSDPPSQGLVLRSTSHSQDSSPQGKEPNNSQTINDLLLSIVDPDSMLTPSPKASPSFLNPDLSSNLGSHLDTLNSTALQTLSDVPSPYASYIQQLSFPTTSEMQHSPHLDFLSLPLTTTSLAAQGGQSDVDATMSCISI